MAFPPSPTSPGADIDDAPTFAEWMQRFGRGLHAMSAALRRRGLWLVFGALGGLIGGIWVAATAKPIVNPHHYYKASVNLSLDRSAMVENAQDTEAWSLRLAQLAATANSYRETVAQQTGTTAVYVKNHIMVTADPDTSQLSVTAIDIDPELTTQVAYHAALALNDAVLATVKARTAAQDARLVVQLNATNAKVTNLKSQIAITPKDQRQSLEDQLALQESTAQFIQFQRDNLAVTPPNFNVITMPDAIPITSKSYYLRWSLAKDDVGAARIQANARLISAGVEDDSNTKKMLQILADETNVDEVRQISGPHRIMMGLLAGLLLGLSGVVLGEAWDDRLHDTDHATSATGFALLTEIPRLSRHSVQLLLRSGRGAKSARIQQAANRYQEAATILAHQLGIFTDHRSSEDPPTAPIVLVTSATPSEGKSTSAAALAAGFAQLGLKVLAANGDYHRTSLRKNLRPIPNFVDPEQPCETSVEGVWLIDDASTERKKRSGTATVSGLVRRIEARRRQFDVVVLDTPPILITTDAADFLHYCDAVALVVRIEQTLVPSSERAATLIRHREVPVSGLIVIDVPLKMIDRNYGPGG